MSATGARRLFSKLAPGYARPGELDDPLRGIEAALLRYRAMAYVVGTGLATLVFVGIPLQYGAGAPQVDEIVGTAHGILYIVYLLAAVDLARRARFTLLQMAAMIGAGFVPLLAFVIEHRVTTRLRRELDVLGANIGDHEAADTSDPSVAVPAPRSTEVRRRWLSPRALVLHAEVLVVAPGCVAAGWWQATQALAGNQLSWVYSVEWPIFAILAVFGWWHLLHEDPDAFRARRWFRASHDADADADAVDFEPAAVAVASVDVGVDGATVRAAKLLALGVAVEFALGIAALLVMPLGRPSGWLPASGRTVYGIHATVGLIVGLAAAAFLARCLDRGRIARIVGWCGAVALALAGAGGLLTDGASMMRFAGICVMFVCSVLAGCAYLVPAALAARNRATGAAGTDRSARAPVG
ncbi:MAG: DUF3817 domain-containing protein [Acidimicrobiales bacterium]